MAAVAPVVNSADAYQAACVAGLGLIQVPVHGMQRLIDVNELVDVMPEFRAAPMPVSLLYPNRRQIAPRVQAMLDWIAQMVGPHLAPSPKDPP